MNYIKRIADMLGVEIGEKFTIKGILNNTYEFTNECLLANRNNYSSKDYYTLGNLLNGTYEIDKNVNKATLTENEKVYLYCLIQPYKNAIITKNSCGDKEYISIKCDYETIDDSVSSFKIITSPSFKKGTMFTSLELNKKYGTRDLGL